MIEGDIHKAQTQFERLEHLPVREEDSARADKFHKSFEASSLTLKWLLLDVVVSSIKCIYIDSMMIKQQADGRLQYDRSISGEKNRANLKKR